MDIKEGLPSGVEEKGRHKPMGSLLPLLVAIIVLLVAGIIAVSAVLSSPLSIVVGGILGACLIALMIYLVLEWWHFREQNKGYIDEITDLNLRFGILADAVSAVSSTLDLEELVANILGVMLTLTNSAIGVVLVPDDSLNYLHVLSHRGFQEKAVRGLKISVGKGAVGKAFQSGQTVIRKNLPEDPRAVETYSEGKSPRSQIIMPLKAKGQMVGMAVTASFEEHEYKVDEVALLSSLCHELAVAMINVDLYQQSQKTLEWLADTQEYTEHFIQEMLAGVAVINNEGDVIYFNHEAANILGIEPKEVIGVNYNDLVEEREKFKSLSFLKPIFRLCMEEERAFRRHEMAIDGPNGRRCTINFNAFPLHRAKGERMGAAVVFMDVSAIKEMESRLRQQDHLSILGQMAAKIAHEVKNPLFAIIGLADELGEEEAVPDRKYLLEMIKQEATLSNQWISGMLSFSKSPFPVGEEAAFILQSSVPELITDFLRSHEQDNVKVVRDFEEGLPPVMMSRDNMRHILFNLLENSMQAMPDGGVITVRAHDTGNGFVEMRVEDTGTGIRAEILPSVFEPFFTTKEGGTGLGLAIVQKILLDIGGDIDVRSQQDLGTTIILKLPSRGVSHERD
ncbi:MAG: PAS domain S-box protein [Actinobacteria bacterium]|jgi:PAS domain S-box-containing protein|nr:MAG: PAS domain S-box protein [Actinomycetota bacterium]